VDLKILDLKIFSHQHFMKSENLENNFVYEFRHEDEAYQNGSQEVPPHESQNW